MNYQKQIRAILEDSEFTADPRHIEALMLSEAGTLDSISRDEFEEMVIEAASFLAGRNDNPRQFAEALAQSYGL